VAEYLRTLADSLEAGSDVTLRAGEQSERPPKMRPLAALNWSPLTLRPSKRSVIGKKVSELLKSTGTPAIW